MTQNKKYKDLFKRNQMNVLIIDTLQMTNESQSIEITRLEKELMELTRAVFKSSRNKFIQKQETIFEKLDRIMPMKKEVSNRLSFKKIMLFDKINVFIDGQWWLWKNKQLKSSFGKLPPKRVWTAQRENKQHMVMEAV